MYSEASVADEESDQDDQQNVEEHEHVHEELLRDEQSGKKLTPKNAEDEQFTYGDGEPD